MSLQRKKLTEAEELEKDYLREQLHFTTVSFDPTVAIGIAFERGRKYEKDLSRFRELISRAVGFKKPPASINKKPQRKGSKD
jgi:hypothetical protein